ncbi:MAG: hypothetical protein KC478_16760 [Bacteriovoracaceae bacterium]|nr:hypothetical protein [Bacteriovoracaceae bacterium]
MKIKSTIALLVGLSFFAQTTLAANFNHQQTEDYQDSVVQVDNHKLIKNVFDKLAYNLTVEWDQEDPYFKKQVQEEFNTSLINLTKEGVSPSEIQAYMANAILDSKTKKEYQELMATIKDQDMSAEAGAKAAVDFMDATYESGATFSSSLGGGGSSSYILVLIIVVAVVYVILHGEDDDGNECDEICEGGDNGYNGYDGYDGYDGYNGYNGYNGTIDLQ